nr:hypothetical protein [Tanacetum cinerariifolium]
MTSLTSMCELACQIVQKNLEEKQLKEAQAVKAQSWKFFVCYDDDDDEEGYNSLNDNILSEFPPYSAVTPTEPIDSLKIVSDNSNADIKSFSPSPIPNKDSDSHMEEIDLFLNPDDPMPPGIEEDDDDFERDISILEELLDNYSLSLPTNESYHFDIP